MDCSIRKADSLAGAAAAAAAAASTESSGDEEERQMSEGEEGQALPAWQLGGGGRQAFHVPHRPLVRTPGDLGLCCSPTIDEVLGGGEAACTAAAAAAAAAATAPQPLQQLWALQHMAQHQHHLAPLQLLSPAPLDPLLPMCQQQPQAEPGQEDAGGGITPGFYLRGCSSSEAACEAIALAGGTSLPRSGQPATTPWSSRPLVHAEALQQRQRLLQSNGGLQRCFEAAASQGEAAPTSSGGGPAEAAAEVGDPIASLRHIPAFRQEAEAAMERVAQAALTAATQTPLRPLPVPPHLQCGIGEGQPVPGSKCQAGAFAGFAAAFERPLPGAASQQQQQEKENRRRADLKSSPPPLSSKRMRGANPFAAFVCTGDGR